MQLGIHTGRGHGELIRDRFGVGWSRLSAIGLIVSTVGSTIAEFTDVAGISEMYGLSRSLTLSIASAMLLGATAM